MGCLLWCLYPGKEGRCFSLKHPDLFWGPSSFLLNARQGLLSWGSSGHSVRLTTLLHRSKVKNKWSYTSTLPHMPSQHIQGKLSCVQDQICTNSNLIHDLPLYIKNINKGVERLTHSVQFFIFGTLIFQVASYHTHTHKTLP
jgi:hypothetical protein